MWFMIKVINPLVSLILRSSLHRIMSKPLLLITYEKHKARKGHTSGSICSGWVYRLYHSRCAGEKDLVAQSPRQDGGHTYHAREICQ